MQTEVLKGSRDFTTKDSVVLKDKGLVLATWDELCDKIESAVIGGELTHAGSDEQGD